MPYNLEETKWPHVATNWYFIIEVHKIDRHDLQYAILTQWLMEEIAISVSDVLIGPMLDTPYTDLKMTILHPTARAKKKPNSTNRTYREPNFGDPHPFSYATVMHSELMNSICRIIG